MPYARHTIIKPARRQTPACCRLVTSPLANVGLGEETVPFAVIMHLVLTLPQGRGPKPGNWAPANLTAAGSNHSLCSSSHGNRHVYTGAKKSGTLFLSPILQGERRQKGSMGKLWGKMGGGVVMANTPLPLAENNDVYFAQWKLESLIECLQRMTDSPIVPRKCTQLLLIMSTEFLEAQNISFIHTQDWRKQLCSPAKGSLKKQHLIAFLKYEYQIVTKQWTAVELCLPPLGNTTQFNFY